MLSKLARTFGMVFIGIPFLLTMAVLAGVFRICMFFGFGHGGLRFVKDAMSKFAVMRVLEILPYTYPVPELYTTNGHIRFTAIFTANARGEPLPPESQEAMLYIARVNFLSRLILVSPETVRQLETALIARRLRVNAVFVFAPNEPARVANTIDFTKK